MKPSVNLFVNTTRRAALSSTSGRFIITLAPRLKPPPTVSDAIPCTAALNLFSVGALVTSFTVPPIDPEP